MSDGSTSSHCVPGEYETIRTLVDHGTCLTRSLSHDNLTNGLMRGREGIGPYPPGKNVTPQPPGYNNYHIPPVPSHHLIWLSMATGTDELGL